jgi:hypothetical protein
MSLTVTVAHTTNATGGDSAGLIGQTAFNGTGAHTITVDGFAGDGGYAFRYAFATATTNTPAAGTIQFNNATLASVTAIYVNETEAAGIALGSIINGINVNDRLMFSNSDRSDFQVFLVTAVPTTTGGVTTFTVTRTAGTAALFAAAETIFLSPRRTADNIGLSAGTTAIAPANIAAGTNKTTTAAGDIMYDGASFQFANAAAARGVVSLEQFIQLNTAYTMVSQTAAQKAFNNPTGGALTVLASTLYFFEGMFNLSAMSVSSGSFGFAFGGTATRTSELWEAIAKKTAPATAAAPQTSLNTAANTTLATASLIATGYFTVRGVVKINAAGTLIPMISLTVAAAAVVGVNSYFRLTPMGANTQLSVGNWA